jgi:hypothetical protein
MKEATSTTGAKVGNDYLEQVGNEDKRVVGIDGDHAMEGLREGDDGGFTSAYVYLNTDMGLNDAFGKQGVSQTTVMDGGHEEIAGVKTVEGCLDDAMGHGMRGKREGVHVINPIVDVMTRKMSNGGGKCGGGVGGRWANKHAHTGIRP